MLKQTAYSFLILMLSFQTILAAQELQSHKEMQVGVILDMGSRVGKVIYRCITMAISDFYKANPHYITQIVFNTRDTKGEPLNALSAVLSFSTSLFSNQNPYLLQIAQDETTQFKGIAAMIESFELKNIILICEDTADGREMAAYIIIAFHDKNIRVTYTSQIPTAASDEQIREEFHKFQDTQTTTFVVHTRPSLASNIFSRAKEVGMMGEGIMWIVTSKTTNFLNFMNDDTLESMQGVVGFKSYFPKSREVHKFVSKWIKEYYGLNPFMDFKVVDFNGVLAYDAVYALAMAVEKVHTEIGASLLDQM
ncbi:hypothetical protein L1987_50702 [Smallanthus sonchifolius]|uniref:Uncharacterized protein n=1 Tax=Smallanthus sonchifolius TaxID=185202 RepID=A0ACB9EN26_9ASTR|nr:hypothetical protein L1987_50702 [Smallanthus sonchifolius]